ncbi:MAG: FCD domain-containing protein [Desulfarculaceae bacterium]|nr:FCD domain-containing protein [Desulfarculaceae bacterium]MCF8072546.1 FCD domain-containing protein [Desulfarculaceae bacterium]MCF8103449.1 FCD domain-containing protein [Desulfarculaceae bacterium]MCF8117087.1 FCD domain-containing protein [Desulfarculaceae bacterium]
MHNGKRKKAYEEVAEAIRSRVFSGQLVQDQQLPPERELAEEFGVSRVVIREAIRTLELAGILRVQKGAGGGTFVCHDLDKPLVTSLENLLAGGDISLNDLFEMRLILEPPAAALAAERSRPQDLGPLREILEQAEQSLRNSRALRNNNLEFHRRLVALAGNPLLSVLCETVLSILVSSLRGKLNRRTSQTVHRFHHQIFQALLAGQADQARKLTIDDLETLRDLYHRMGVEVAQDQASRKAS